MDKTRIRKQMLSKRNMLTKEEIEDLSGKIRETLMKIPAYNKSKTVMLYLNFGSEVECSEITKDCLASGKTVVLPYCNTSDKSITPTRIKSLDLDLTKNKMGYAQPPTNALDPVDKSEIDLIIVPGIAFDRKGFRIGFGAGYYDRFLAEMNFKATTIGLAYDFQIIDSFIKMESHDIPVDYVLTEERIIVRTE